MPDASQREWHLYNSYRREQGEADRLRGELEMSMVRHLFIMIAWAVSWSGLVWLTVQLYLEGK